MSSRVLTFWLAALVAVSACAADEPSQDGATSFADRVAAIRKDHQEYEKKFYADLGAFRDDDKKIRELNDEYQDFTQRQGNELTALIKAHAKEGAAFDGILVLSCDLGWPLDDELVRLVLGRHLADPRMGRLCWELQERWTEAWAKRLLEAAAAKNPMKDVRGQALYALGMYHRLRAEPHRFGGDGIFAKLSEEEEARRLAEASKYFTEVTKDYAAVKTPGGKVTLGDRAVAELLRIKNLPHLKVGKTAPDIVGEDLDGNKLSLREYRGKVVLLDFWGHW